MSVKFLGNGTALFCALLAAIAIGCGAPSDTPSGDAGTGASLSVSGGSSGTLTGNAGVVTVGGTSTALNWSAGSVTLQDNATNVVQIGQMSTDFIALGSSPAASGYVRLPSGGAVSANGNLALNAGSGSQVLFEVNSQVVGSITGSALTSAVPSFAFGASATTPSIKQTAPSTDVAPQPLLVQAQSAETGAASNKNGADLQLSGGTAAAGGINGYVDLHNAPTTTTAPGAGGAGALPATPKGYVSVKIGGTLQQIAYY